MDTIESTALYMVFRLHIVLLKVKVATMSRVHHKQLQKGAQRKHYFFTNHQTPVKFINFLV
jgi:hypothetical protein